MVGCYLALYHIVLFNRDVYNVLVLDNLYTRYSLSIDFRDTEIVSAYERMEHPHPKACTSSQSGVCVCHVY